MHVFMSPQLLTNLIMANIKKLFFNPRFSGSFAGLSSFYRHRKLGITKKETEKELLKIPEYFMYRPARKKIKRRRVLVHFVNFQLTFDLIDVQRWSKENSNYRYIFICLDAFSRKLYTVPLKDKTGKSLISAMSKVFKQMPKLPRYCHSDSGTEFTNKLFQNFLKSKGIIWFTTYSSTKANIAERAISTLMGKLTRVFAHQHNHKFIKVLPLITASINNTVHSSIGTKPNLVTEKNQADVWRYLYKDLLNPTKRKKPQFSVGQRVRVSLVKTLFEKGCKSLLKFFCTQFIKL